MLSQDLQVWHVKAGNVKSTDYKRKTRQLFASRANKRVK